MRGEIISADSMQLYKKADIMTAKVTESEKSLVKHHMIDVVELHHKNFNRNEYYLRAQPIIEALKE